MERISKNEFVGVVAGIKNEIRTSRVKAMMAANNELVMMYFRIGRILYESSLNDVHFLKRLETELKLEFPGTGGLGVRNLQRMAQFYDTYKNDKNATQLVTQLSWSHNVILLSRAKDPAVRGVYMRAAIENGWSFVGNQYKLTVGYEDYYLGLLFCHLRLRCYVVVELNLHMGF